MPGAPRPTKEVDWDTFDQLCSLQCTQIEIAYQLGMSVDTLATRIREKYNTSFSELFRERRGPGLVSLRTMQYNAAKNGDTQMMKWLGVNWLDQKSQSITVSDERPLNYVAPESMLDDDDNGASAQSIGGSNAANNVSEIPTNKEGPAS